MPRSKIECHTSLFPKIGVVHAHRFQTLEKTLASFLKNIFSFSRPTFLPGD